jgi:hypothetical protein
MLRPRCGSPSGPTAQALADDLHRRGLSTGATVLVPHLSARSVLSRSPPKLCSKRYRWSSVSRNTHRSDLLVGWR